jgi:TonB family protein
MSTGTKAAILFAMTILACAGETRPTNGNPGPFGAPPSSIPAPRVIGWTRDDAGAFHDVIASRSVPLGQHVGWSVGPLGNQILWARFLDGVRTRLHATVSDEYLSGVLDHSAKEDPRNDPRLRVRLELAFGAVGNLAFVRVVRSSGAARFDEEIEETVRRAAPSPVAPSELQSPDGNVYAEWEIHRDEVFGCSPMNARPWRFVNASDDGGVP